MQRTGGLGLLVFGAAMTCTGTTAASILLVLSPLDPSRQGRASLRSWTQLATAHGDWLLDIASQLLITTAVDMALLDEDSVKGANLIPMTRVAFTLVATDASSSVSSVSLYLRQRCEGTFMAPRRKTRVGLTERSRAT